MSEKNTKVVITNNKKNTDYVVYTKQINLHKIKEALFIPDHIKEDFEDIATRTEEDWKELDGDYFVNIIKGYTSDKVYVALNDFQNDDPKFISFSKDGGVFASSDLPSVDLQNEMYYTGDENLDIGQREPFKSTQSWLYYGIEEVYSSEQLGLTGETLKYLLEDK